MDYQLEDTVFLPFTTRAFATGIPTVLAGTPAVDIYEDATATPIVTGETLVVDLNSVVGFNMITVTATAATGFNVGGHYTAILQAGTVGGVSVVGEVVAEFTIDNSAAAKDLANATDGLGALKTVVDAIPTTAMRGTDSAALASVCTEGRLAELDGAKLPASVDAIPTTAMRGTDSAALASVCTEGRLAELDAANLPASVDAIPTTAMRGTDSALLAASINLTAGAVDTVTTLTGHTAQTGDSFARIGAAGASLTDLGGMSTGMKAEILVEVNAALDTAISELTQAAPTATPNLRTGLMLLYMALRNRLDVDTSGTDEFQVHNDAGVVVAKKLLTDDGADFSEAEMISGP